MKPPHSLGCVVCGIFFFGCCRSGSVLILIVDVLLLECVWVCFSRVFFWGREGVWSNLMGNGSQVNCDKGSRVCICLHFLVVVDEFRSEDRVLSGCF